MRVVYITQVEFRTASEFVDQARLHRKGVDLEADYATEMVRRYMVAEYKDAAYQRGYRVTTTSTPGCSVPPRMRCARPCGPMVGVTVITAPRPSTRSRAPMTSSSTCC